MTHGVIRLDLSAEDYESVSDEAQKAGQTIQAYIRGKLGLGKPEAAPQQPRRVIRNRRIDEPVKIELDGEAGKE